ncbi:hypothetical protein Nepgr_002094 [Nepenthes gracilis]|uniref:Uncharacterized protein n=1 Tax=Nepenthes gracilis TaxID=150966 RepID=A0AAD3P3E7_NEPGR|nr:hypothetical protein Nepgr_002094 [Nepenthes gracilis]
MLPLATLAAFEPHAIVVEPLSFRLRGRPTANDPPKQPNLKHVSNLDAQLCEAHSFSDLNVGILKLPAVDSYTRTFHLRSSLPVLEMRIAGREGNAFNLFKEMLCVSGVLRGQKIN